MSNSSQVNTKVDTIIIKGNQFVSEATGSRFYVHGINFDGKKRPEQKESLLDGDDCSLTIPGLLALGINVILVTFPDTTQDGTICMEQFQAAGIYLLVLFYISTGLSQYETYWNNDEYSDQTKLIDYPSPYSNVIGFVFNRPIFQDEIPRPFEDVMDDRSGAYQRFEVPPVIMDKSCSRGRARNFTWVSSLFGPRFSTVWSGGIFDEWYSWTEGYALVNITNDEKGWPRLSKISRIFDPLHSNSICLGHHSYRVDQIAYKHEYFQLSNQASTNLPPRQNLELCNCMMNSLSCVVPEVIPVAVVPTQMFEVCELNATYCLGFSANGTSGKYGAYSGCSLYQQYSWALDRLTIGQVQHGNSTTCNFSSWGRSQTSSTSSPTSSRPGLFTNIKGSPRASQPILSSGGIAGVAIGAAIFVLMIIGSIVLWRRKKSGKTSMANTSSEGLEVGEAPPGLGHNVELRGDGREIERGMTENAIELPDSVPLQELSDGLTTTRLTTMGSPGKGEYTAVSRVDPELEASVTMTAEDILPAKGIKRKPLASVISSSWAGATWFDPNDSRQVLPNGSASRPDGQGD
ncbi:Glucanosyltransferase-domain-containing protein [Leptodontidium sp. 2 PMI_412]|nr:Glucanosyltransferase-domain-containing protein [Leptodontidium sp. 2 PMI_412]